MTETQKSQVRLYRECAVRVVQSGYTCAGCQGDAVCGIFKLWKAVEESDRERHSGIHVVWHSDTELTLEFIDR